MRSGGGGARRDDEKNLIPPRNSRRLADRRRRRRRRRRRPVRVTTRDFGRFSRVLGKKATDRVPDEFPLARCSNERRIAITRELTIVIRRFDDDVA